MRELLYLSTAKLRNFSLDEPRRLVTTRELEFGVNGIASARLGPAPQIGPLTSYQVLEQVLRQLHESRRAPRPITDPALRPGDWAEFESEIKFGHFHRDKAKVYFRVVLFRGAIPEPAPRTIFDYSPLPEPDGTDFLLCGWIGHMIDGVSLGEWSHRMGSATEDVFRLWSDVAELDSMGAEAVPGEFGRLSDVRSSQTAETLAEVIRSIYGMGTWTDSPHIDMSIERAYAHGIARVLDVIPADEYRNRLVLGTPLYVEYASRPVPPAEPLEKPGLLRRIQERLTRRKPAEIDPVDEQLLLEPPSAATREPVS